MRPVLFAAALLGAFAVSGSTFAQEQPASSDGKSVPMQKAPEKIKTGKAKHHSMKHSKKM